MYEILWHDDAAAFVEEIYFAADTSLRDRFGKAILEAERQLKDHPESVGESRDDQDRIAFFDCIGVLFEVNTSSQQVLIREIWVPKRKR